MRGHVRDDVRGGRSGFGRAANRPLTAPLRDGLRRDQTRRGQPGDRLRRG